MTRWGEQVDIITAGFGFELCGECGRDVDRHRFGPDPLGNAHAWCEHATENAHQPFG
jgi:hypothetical protein